MAAARAGCLSGGAIFEQAGVGFSHVFGEEMPPSATRNRPELGGHSFRRNGRVAGITSTQSLRADDTCEFQILFAGIPDEGEPVWWFGGGFDLTPYYPFHDDVLHWHQKAKEACDPFGDDVYEKYKKWCDEYFYLKHREETRGVGGLFFDDLNEPGFDKSFEFTKSVGDQFLPAYLPIVKARSGHKYGERQREFQLYRRGRYVEFNLIYDRGTLFGLQSGGRTESILMSLPPRVRWEYDWKPGPGSPEADLYENYLRHGTG